MNPTVKWATEFAASLIEDDATAGRSIETTLETRIAVGLIQARAFEARSAAGELSVRGLAQRDPKFNAMHAKLIERSSELEAIGVDFPLQIRALRKQLHDAEVF
jgi:hypothetical protein